MFGHDALHDVCIPSGYLAPLPLQPVEHQQLYNGILPLVIPSLILECRQGCPSYLGHLLCRKNLGRIVIRLDILCHFNGIIIDRRRDKFELLFRCDRCESHYRDRAGLVTFSPSHSHRTPSPSCPRNGRAGTETGCNHRDEGMPLL